MNIMCYLLVTRLCISGVGLYTSQTPILFGGHTDCASVMSVFTLTVLLVVSFLTPIHAYAEHRRRKRKKEESNGDVAMMLDFNDVEKRRETKS